MMCPTCGYVSAWRMNSIFDIWRKTFSPNPSTYATVILPPVPVAQPLFFQHLSARARLTFISARWYAARAMFRALGFFGSRLAANSVFAMVEACAVYVSPYAPPFPTTGDAP